MPQFFPVLLCNEADEVPDRLVVLLHLDVLCSEAGKGRRLDHMEAAAGLALLVR